MALLAALAAPSPAPAQQPANPWVDQRVITQYGTVLQIGGKVVDDAGRNKSLARGKDQATFRVYKVQQAKGSWLWIVAENSSAKGWVRDGDLIPFDQAVDYYTNRIRANPNDATRYISRGNVWNAPEELDIAIADYNEAIRLDPGDSTAYVCRGNAWSSKKEYNKAIADYNQAIRLDPADASTYNGRGNARRDKKAYRKAIADFDESIRLDPSDSWPPWCKALARLSMAHGDVITDARSAIEKGDWKNEWPIYGTIVGHLGARRVKNDDAAKAFPDEASAKADKELWPYPLVRLLRREVNERALLDQAVDNDKMTVARCYLAFDQLLDGRMAEARANFQWVKDHGTPGFVNIGLSVAELDRMDKDATDAALESSAAK